MSERPPPRVDAIRRLRTRMPELKHPEARNVEELGWDTIGLVYEGLAFGNRAARQASEAVIREYDLGPRGPWILNLISNGIEYPLELASIFRVGRSLITIELQRLTDAGLIEASPGKTDRRRTSLTPTPEGWRATQRVRDEMLRIARANLAGYSAEDILLFIRMLRDMRGGDDAPPD